MEDLREYNDFSIIASFEKILASLAVSKKRLFFTRLQLAVFQHLRQVPARVVAVVPGCIRVFKVQQLVQGV